MATRTIARMFDSYADATAAVRDLEAAGFTHDDISLIGRQAEAGATDEDRSDAGSGAATGATLGAIVGGGAGLLAGIGALAIPGLGPVVAAGWLVAALTGAGIGAATGGLIGSLTGAGIGEEEAHVYAEGVRRGGTLVTVRTDDTRADEAERILARHNPVDVAARGAEYRSGGWTRYDESATTSAGTGIGTASMAAASAGMAGSMTGSRDGTPGNPPGTMASRGVDDALGTNISGARPENERGAMGSDLDRGAGGVGASSTVGGLGSPDGTPGNPPGTMVSRGVDEVAGTNISGAHPENEDEAERRRRAIGPNPSR